MAAELDEKLFAFYGTQKFITVFPVLSQINPAYIFPLCLSTIHSSDFLSVAVFSTWSLPFQFPY